MCGDLEEEGGLEAGLLQRFLQHGHALLARPVAGDGAGDLNRYLDGLFADLLRRCMADAQASPAGYRQLAMQSLVLARVAGFLAGHVALQEDPLRKLMEALMLGYSEAETAAPPHDHGHDHGHGHGHGHGQGHAH
jgi:hypothetical protein